MMRWILLLVTLVCAALPASGSDQPDRTAALGTYLASHGYGLVRVTTDRANNEYLNAKINGRNVRFKVDTGAVHTVITAECAHDLGLDVQATKMTDFGVGGFMKGHDGVASVKSFTINNYEINRLSLITVLPKGADVGSCDGLFGFDYLKANAVLLPVGARILIFKPGRAPVPPIDAYMHDLGFKLVPVRYEKGGLHIDGHLNGQPLNAVIDCGASFSTFNISFVTDKARVTAAYLDNFQMTGVDGRHNDSWVFTPESLDVGSFVIKPTKLIACDIPTAKLLGFDALFGYDLLAEHKAIIDLGHDTLWMQ